MRKRHKQNDNLVATTPGILTPETGETLGRIVDRLTLSAQGAVQGDRGFQKTCMVETRDLMFLVSAAHAAGPRFLAQRFVLTRSRDDKSEVVAR